MSESKSTSAIMRILNELSYKRITELPEPDLGLAENRPYPFLAIVGQMEMRTALLLSMINPAVGGVLLIGPRGTGKTTAVRSLTQILPLMEMSTCEEGILPDDLATLSEEEGKFLYPDCYDKYQRGESISQFESVKLVELPLNARLEDVVGGINERAAVHNKSIKVERGILSRADNNILYVDEVNLLEDQIVDAILDAAAQGSFSVRRGAVAGTYRSRFVLVGSMNPEEGRLRPQILDRFGLRVTVKGLTDKEERAEVYRRARAFRLNPTKFIHGWAEASAAVQDEIILARDLLRETELSDEAIFQGLNIIQQLHIDSHRAEYTMFEAARAYAAADYRTTATVDDIRMVAPMALRQRRSEFMNQFFSNQEAEDEQIRAIIDES